MKKKIVSIILAFTLSFSLIACSSAKESGTTSAGSGDVNTGSQQNAGQGTQATTGEDLVSEYIMQAFKSTEESDYGAYDMCEEEPMAYESINASAMMGMTASNDWDGDFIEWNTEEYSYQPENQWISVRTNAFSTFAADVDTASYANVRRMLTRQQQVPVDAVRLEEMINYFHYDYPQPKAGEPFSVTTEMAPCPWNDNAKLLMIGVAAPELDTSERANSNLVFLIDVSGSMDGEDRLGLVQRSFKLLCEELRPGDRVSIVTYANGDRVVLEGATGDEKSVITDAI